MSKITVTEESRRTVEIETEEEWAEAYLQINPGTLEANRALFTEDDIRFYHEYYGFNPFQTCRHKAGAEAHVCTKVRVSAEGAAVSRRVDQWSGKQRDRERRAQAENGITVVPLDDSMAESDGEPYAYEIPDDREPVREVLQREKMKAIRRELAKVKPYYPKIFEWLYLGCCSPTLVEKELGIPKSTAFDDIRRVRKIAAEVLKRYE